MNTVSKNLLSVFTVVIILLKTTVAAQDVDPPFKVNEVSKKVSYNQRQLESRAFEFLLDTCVTYFPSTGWLVQPAVAFDGVNYFVVWHDGDICGARVSLSGELLDPAGIAISTAPGAQAHPSVAFDGTNYLVVWKDDRAGATDIYCARVTCEGIVLDTSGILVSHPAWSRDYYPAGIVFDGTNYFIVWATYVTFSNSDIYGARVNQSGVVLDSSGIPIATDLSWQECPAVSFDGVNYIIAWKDNETFDQNIYGVRVSQDGTVIDTSRIAISTASNDQVNPSVTFNGSRYLVAWEDYRNNVVDGDIYCTRVHPSGGVYSPEGVRVSWIAGNKVYPKTNSNGDYFYVSWAHFQSGSTYDIHGAYVSWDGNPGTTCPVCTASDNQQYPSVAFDGTNYMVVWEDKRGPSSNIYGVRVSSFGSVIDTTDILITKATYSQDVSDVVSSDSSFLAAWNDFRACTSSTKGCDIYGTRVNLTGEVLDSTAFAISTATNDQFFPAVASDGTDYLVVWHDCRNGVGNEDIYGSRVDQTGLVLEPWGISISPLAGQHRYPDVAFGDTNYFVVWQTGGYSDIYGTRVDTSGTVLDPDGIVICPGVWSQKYPSITFDGINYFVVWDNHVSNHPNHIYGARVNQAGVLIDTTSIIIYSDGYFYNYPSVAYGNACYLVVWADLYIDGYDIFGCRVDTDGNVLDSSSIAISNAPDNQFRPTVTHDGSNFIVVWDDFRSGSSYDIYGAKVNADGEVIDSFLVSSQPKDQTSPATAYNAAGRTLTTYSGWVDSINTHPARTTRIWGKFYPFIGVEEDLELSNQTVISWLRVYPNPIHKTCNVKYSLPQKTRINLSMYDVTGRLVKKLVNQTQNAGVYQRTFELTDLAQGIYFIRLNTEDTSEIQKVILIK